MPFFICELIGSHSVFLVGLIEIDRLIDRDGYERVCEKVIDHRVNETAYTLFNLQQCIQNQILYNLNIHRTKRNAFNKNEMYSYTKNKYALYSVFTVSL